MKKLLFLFVTAFLVVSCNKSDVRSDNETATPLSNSGISFDKVYEEIKGEYKESPMMNNCLVNSVNMCLNQAVNEKARAKNDESLCDDLNDKMSAEYCKQGIIQTKIDKTGNLSLCNSLKQNKDNCISQAALSLAIKKKDLKVCDNIKDPVNNSGSNMPPIMSTKSNCINQASFNLAMTNQDEKYCDKITIEDQKKMCKNSIAMQKNPGILPVGTAAPISR